MPRGGRRPGAGRPKGTKNRRTIHKEKYLERPEIQAAAEDALKLMIEFMYDESLKPGFRAGCASEVMDRVWGRPTQRNVNENTADVEVWLHWDEETNGPPAPTPSSTETGQG